MPQLSRSAVIGVLSVCRRFVAERSGVPGAGRLVLAVAVLFGLAPTADAATRAGRGERASTEQWHLDRPAIDARRAWTTTRGDHVVVAVIDSGVKPRHRDLTGNLWKNSREVAGNGVDDDANGHVDDVRGWDFVAQDADPDDEHGHGTHVAGVVAARGEDRFGGTGVAPEARIMALRVLDAQNRGTADMVAAALRYAVSNGARVANLSLNTATPSPEIDAAIAEAAAAGVLVVVSAGNEHADLDAAPSYPACSSSPNVIAVAASDRTGGLADFSNFGASCVDIAAPGTDIVAAGLGGLETRSGTSMATPQVAGAAALLLAARPNLTIAQLRASLLETATHPTGAAGRRNATGSPRRLNVMRGLRAALRVR